MAVKGVVRLSDISRAAGATGIAHKPLAGEEEPEEKEEQEEEEEESQEE